MMLSTNIRSCRYLFNIGYETGLNKFKYTNRFRDKIKYLGLQRHTTTAIETNVVRPFTDIPGPGGIYNIPYIGILFNFVPFTKHTLPNIHLLLKEFHYRYGDIVKYKTGSTWTVLIYHPKDAQRVCTIPQDNPYRTPVDIVKVYCERNNVTEGLATVQGTEWASIRKPATEQMLKPKTVQNYIPIINTVADDFIEKLKRDGRIDDCLKEMVTYTTESVGLLCYNKRMGYYSDDKPQFDIMPPLLDIFDVIHKTFYSITKAYRYFRSPTYIRFENAAKTLQSLSQEMISTRRQELDAQKKDGIGIEDNEPDLLHALLSDPRITTEQAYSLIDSLFLGGVDSTATTLTFLLHKLACNPDKQELLRKEISEQCPVGKPFHKDAFNEMPYLKACLKESFRMVPPGIVSSSRRFEEDVIISGYHIPKHTDIMIIANPMSENDNFFPNPKEFLPERWLRTANTNGVKTRNIYPFSSIPFGYGPRSCIGQRFAENQIYVAITKIFQHFRLHLDSEDHEISFTYKTFATPNKKVSFILEHCQN